MYFIMHREMEKCGATCKFLLLLRSDCRNQCKNKFTWADSLRAVDVLRSEGRTS